MQTIDKEGSLIPPFAGNKDLLIIGFGEVSIYKSLNGMDFYPIKDMNGAQLAMSSDVDGVIYNGKMDNSNSGVHYKLVPSEGTSAKWEMK